jgi:hypothetical protein
VDYAEIIDSQSLEPVSDVASGVLIAVAAWVGSTRLIDNVVISAERAQAAQSRFCPESAEESLHTRRRS